MQAIAKTGKTHSHMTKTELIAFEYKFNHTRKKKALINNYPASGMYLFWKAGKASPI